MIASLSLMVASMLQVGVVGDAPVAQTAARELSAQGFSAQHCAAKELACIDDDACRLALISACDVDALVGVEVRTESDGEWRRTLVVDGEGAVALSLDQPADGNLIVPTIAVETLRAMPPRPRAEIVGPAPREREVSAEVHEEFRMAGSDGYSPVFWAGVIASSVGVVVAGTAVTFAGLAEAERAEPTTPADARVDAGDRARVLWLGAAAGAVVAVTGAATACANTDMRGVAPEYQKWCIE